MGVTLATAIARERHTHQTGIQAVLQVAAQDAVLDQHRPTGRGAFVVNVERPAPTRQRPVIDHRDRGGRHLLADAAAEGRDLFAIEVSLQTMTDSLVQQDTGPTRPEDNIEIAGWSIDGIEIDDRLSSRLAREVL